jgi:hypothetical protein
MTAIWQNDETGWHLLVPGGFPNEATLHDLVEQVVNTLKCGPFLPSNVSTGRNASGQTVPHLDSSLIIL